MKNFLWASGGIGPAQGGWVGKLGGGLVGKVVLLGVMGGVGWVIPGVLLVSFIAVWEASQVVGVKTEPCVVWVLTGVVLSGSGAGNVFGGDALRESGLDASVGRVPLSGRDPVRMVCSGGVLWLLVWPGSVLSLVLP